MPFGVRGPASSCWICRGRFPWAKAHNVPGQAVLRGLAGPVGVRHLFGVVGAGWLGFCCGVAGVGVEGFAVLGFEGFELVPGFCSGC